MSDIGADFYNRLLRLVNLRCYFIVSVRPRHPFIIEMFASLHFLISRASITFPK